MQIAEKLGLENEGKKGERLSYAEELERKAERAEARADRFEAYSDNAEKRGAQMQAEFNSYHGDIAFFTQPNINSSAGRAFTNRRQRILDRYEKGFDEYRKSEYFLERATTARSTADMAQLKNPVYLHNRIKEQNKRIRQLQKSVATIEDNIYRLEQGEEVKAWNGSLLTLEGQESRLGEALDNMEYEIDKLAFFENALDEIGGNRFSRDNVKPGYIANIKRSGRRCEILSAGPVNVTYKILDGGAAGMVLTAPYAAIIEIVQAVEKTARVENPFSVGDILCKHYGMSTDNAVYKAYEVIKVTETGVKIQQIEVENREPIPGRFIDKPMQKKVTKSKYSDFVGVYDDDWQLHKYTPKASA